MQNKKINDQQTMSEELNSNREINKHLSCYYSTTTKQKEKGVYIQVKLTPDSETNPNSLHPLQTYQAQASLLDASANRASRSGGWK